MKRIDPKNRPTSNISWIAASILMTLLFLAGLMKIMNPDRDHASTGNSGSDQSSMTGERAADSATAAQ